VRQQIQLERAFPVPAYDKSDGPGLCGARKIARFIFTTDMCGEYACPFTLLLDWRKGTRQIVEPFSTTEQNLRLLCGSLGDDICKPPATFEEGTAARAGKVSILSLCVI